MTTGRQQRRATRESSASSSANAYSGWLKHDPEKWTPVFGKDMLKQ